MTLLYLDTFIAFAAVMLSVSLVITVVTQIVSGLLGHRGRNLCWGVRTLLENSDPTLKKYAEKIAEDALCHPLVSDSKFSYFGKLWRRSLTWWRLANAVRREELLSILKSLASPPHEKDAKNPTVAKNATDQPEGFVERKLKVLKEPPAEIEARRKALAERLAKVEATINEWFERTMDRVAERFAISMRLWTAALSLVIAAALHLDAPVLLKRLSQDSALRGGLVTVANTVVQESAQVLGADGATNAYRLAVLQLRSKHPAETASLTNNPPAFYTPEEVRPWLRSNLGPKSPLLAEYEQMASSNAVAQATVMLGRVERVQDQLAQAGLQLLPDYRTLSWKDYSPTQASFWGMLASAALLSLGAPFWFNALKAAMNLRPIVAKRVDKEKEESQKPVDKEKEKSQKPVDKEKEKSPN